MNRVIQDRDLSVLDVTGPGHGGPGLVANAYLEGTYSDVHDSISRDQEGMRLFRQFSFPGGIPSHGVPRHPDRSTRAASRARVTVRRSPTRSHRDVRGR